MTHSAFSAAAPGDDDSALPAHSVSWQVTSEVAPETLTRYLDDAAATAGVQQAAAYALSLLRLTPGQRVVDVGCGTGVFLPALSRAVGESGLVVGLDHAPALLEEAKRRMQRLGLLSQVQLERADAASLPFPDGSFDAAHISRVLIHVEDPNAVLREMKRVTRPGGWIVAVEPDFLGMRIDHSDPQTSHALVQAFCSGFRHPGMGLELWRRFSEVGLVERELRVVTEIDAAYTEDVATYTRQTADRAVALGLLSPQQARFAVEYLDHAGSLDRYATYSSLFVAAGRVAPEQ
jgi:SAM-dependent methyltransferase